MKLSVTSLVTPVLAALLVLPVLSFAAGEAAPKTESKAAAAPVAVKVSKPDLVKGEASFTAVCASCHGADGNSGTPVNPKLSQQHPEYLVKR